MKNIIIAILATLSIGLFAMEKVDEIRVFVKSTNAPFVEITGKHYVEDPINNNGVFKRFLGKGYIMQSIDNGLKWGEIFPDMPQIALTPYDDSKILIEGTQYPGTIIVYSDKNTLKIVNKVDIEDYLKSILATDFPSPKYNEKTLQALAIVVRTNLSYNCKKTKNKLWDFDGANHKYQGSISHSMDNEIENAVDKTKGKIMLYDNSLLFDARWNENSYGITGDYEKIIQKSSEVPLYGIQTSAPEDNDSKWMFSITKQELSQALNINDVKNIFLYADKRSKRIYAAKIFSDEEVRSLSFDDLQKLCNKNLKSNLFSIEIDDKTIVFSGFGKGHGVGMCLYTADKLANEGYSVEDILTYFFPKIYIS